MICSTRFNSVGVYQQPLLNRIFSSSTSTGGMSVVVYFCSKFSLILNYPVVVLMKNYYLLRPRPLRNLFFKRKNKCSCHLTLKRKSITLRSTWKKIIYRSERCSLFTPLNMTTGHPKANRAHNQKMCQED